MSRISRPCTRLSAKQIDLRFQYCYHNIYPQAIRLVASGVIDLKPLVSPYNRLDSAGDITQSKEMPQIYAVIILLKRDA